MTIGAWGYRLYAFVPPAKVGAFIDYLAPRQLESTNELYMLNQRQYDVIGQNPASGYYMYAAISTPILTSDLGALLSAFGSSLSGTLYFVLSAETGLITHTSGGASIGATLTYAQAVTALNLEPAAQLTALQALSTVYNATPITNVVTSGGNNATPIIVTSLADSGVGTLRDALTRNYPRHVTFAAGLHGTIDLQYDILAAPNLTWDARARGICVKGGHVQVDDETIIVNMRLRNGIVNYPGQGYIDCLSVLGDNVYLKNCSLTHGADSNFEILGTNVLAEECLFAQQMDGYGRKGVNITQGGGNATLYRCVIAHVGDRSPTLFSGMRVDILNCVIANCGTPLDFQPRDSESKVNMIRNRVIKGNLSAGFYVNDIVNYVNNPSEPNSATYIANSGLYMLGNVNVNAPGLSQAQMIQLSGGVFAIPISDTPFTDLHVSLASLVTADAAMETSVLAAVGAQPRDSIDTAIVAAIASRATVYFPETNAEIGFPDLTLLSY